MTTTTLRTVTFALLSLSLAVPVSSDDSARILTLDHFVSVKSTVPAIAGQSVADPCVRRR